MIRSAPSGRVPGAARAPARRRRLRLPVLALAALLSACASFPSVRPEPPRVSVAGVRPLNLSLTRQRLEFRLLVENPNDYELPLRSLDFVAQLGGERIAAGRSDERVTIPAKGEAVIEVDVVAGVGRLFSRMREMLERKELDLDYDVRGSVRLDNWPARIPFDVAGVIENPRAGEARTEEP